jgi:diguanylate cyclase (GGDEF)-like protein
MEADRRQGSPMQQKTIDFRQLVERLMPLQELPSSDRVRVERALEAGVAVQLEEAARYLLSRLELSGAARRLPPDPAGRRLQRWQLRGSLDQIAIESAAPREHEGLVEVPRPGLGANAQAGLEQIRRLLRLDEAMLAADPRTGQARRALLEQLDQAGRELLGAGEVRFVADTEDDERSGPEPLSAALAERARRQPGHLLHCPETELCPELAVEGRRRGIHSVVITAVTAADGRPLGWLEVLAPEPAHFAPDALALVALLADSCAGVLQRAARIEKLVFIDPLTTVYNRAYFELQLRNEMARATRENSSMALCIADIDDFKSFNTAFGYDAGDRVLVEVARALRGGVRPFDTVARWGGEEFAILLTPPVHAHDVVAVSERLRSMVERLGVELEGLDRQHHHVGVTMSVGVALFPDHAGSAEDLWRSANQALLRAKRPPKNKVVFFTPQHHHA